MRYDFIERHRSKWPLDVMCRVLQASRDGYYQWRKGVEGKRKQEDRELLAQINEIYQATERSYGAEWIAHDIRKGGRRVGKTRVRRLMKQNGMPVQCKNIWKCMATTNSSETYHPSSDLVQRAFHRTELDELWLSDYSELPAIGPKIYAVAIKDQASHRILGIHVSHDLHVGALFKAFHQAVIARRLKHRTLEVPIIFHSDQGGQYNSYAFKDELKKYGLVSSMGSSGDCYDNAPMESFWATMKTELMHHFPFRNVEHAAGAIYRWTHLFYNQRRRHTSIGGLSPVQFEVDWYQRNRSVCCT
jgi:transposase InsO family protein